MAEVAVMNTQITREVFERFSSLNSTESMPRLSILIGVDEHAAMPKTAQTVLKNALRKSKQRLLDAGFTPEGALEFLAPVQHLAESDQLWEERAPGLAVFSNGTVDGTFFYRLPFHVSEVVIVASHFYFKPLLATLHSVPIFYVLAISLNGVRLYRFHDHTREIVRLPGAPNSVNDLPSHEDLDTQRHARSFTSSTPRGLMTTHSHGAGDIRHDAHAARFFSKVAHAVDELLKHQNAALVLAGVERDITHFRQACTYPHLIHDVIRGNPQIRSVEDIHKEATALLAQETWADTAHALQRYKDVNNTPRVTRSTKDIVRAAHEGRIDTLFVAQDIDKWGVFDPATEQVRMHPLPQPGDISLLNLAAELTLHHHGDVFLLPRSRVPRNSPMAAILRG
jgi:hypothetical protein